MSWMKWLPWRYVVKRVAHRHGFLDPIALLGKLHSFAQPSEVGEPIELLRAGVVFHARGLINSRVIQHNLDWVWPYWVERQFDPMDPSFIPRAFSITHINLSNRNWTAIGQPDVDELPVVDPRGLLTPFHDGWSLDAWVLADDGRCLLPSRSKTARQRQEFEDGPCVVTESELNGLSLTSRSRVVVEKGRPVCEMVLKARSETSGSLVLSLRPANPEGISFINRVGLSEQRDAWSVDGRQAVFFSRPAESHHVSDYRQGDVRIHLQDKEDQSRGECDVGMVTAAALFGLQAGEESELTVRIPLKDESAPTIRSDGWDSAIGEYARLECPDENWQFLYQAALHSLVLHSPEDVYPGPYTYKRFWFRDAAFIIHALLCAGLTDRAERALYQFPARQLKSGYFRSQEGEWDANGEVLWILRRFHELTGRPLHHEWQEPVRKALAGSRTNVSATRLMSPMPVCCPPDSVPSTWGPMIITTGTISGALPASRRPKQCLPRLTGKPASILVPVPVSSARPLTAAWQPASGDSSDRECQPRPIVAWMPAPSALWRWDIPRNYVNRMIPDCSTASSFCSKNAS